MSLSSFWKNETAENQATVQEKFRAHLATVWSRDFLKEQIKKAASKNEPLIFIRFELEKSWEPFVTPQMVIDYLRSIQCDLQIIGLSQTEYVLTYLPQAQAMEILVEKVINIATKMVEQKLEKMRKSSEEHLERMKKPQSEFEEKFEKVKKESSERFEKMKKESEERVEKSTKELKEYEEKLEKTRKESEERLEEMMKLIQTKRPVSPGIATKPMPDLSNDSDSDDSDSDDSDSDDSDDDTSDN